MNCLSLLFCDSGEAWETTAFLQTRNRGHGSILYLGGPRRVLLGFNTTTVNKFFSRVSSEPFSPSVKWKGRVRLNVPSQTIPWMGTLYAPSQTPAGGEGGGVCERGQVCRWQLWEWELGQQAQGWEKLAQRIWSLVCPSLVSKRSMWALNI